MAKQGLPLAILAIFSFNFISAFFSFFEELDSKEASDHGSRILFRFYHDLEGDMINIDGKNWTVRGESILDYWSQQVQNMTDLDSMDLIVTDSGMFCMYYLYLS